MEIVSKEPDFLISKRKLNLWFCANLEGTNINFYEGTNLENQSQMNVAFWIFGKWRLDPSAPEPPK